MTISACCLGLAESAQAALKNVAWAFNRGGVVGHRPA
eukprot:CAMPEP_0174381736 /NCGR_PEP_ID=MMETSP0811_2-20130205/124209_1 /TAXON_ID=73025 ORGANISM="Eutreptiella gymnastica-like, Strain CCMP1594" /NCGR_SAMPLE_ID=MMETSP0811_2 /ASSEMBLY_ACC=CAM_ASM_000667 /LENGTH=36 /DNA_ID= /DNA_START= /DNA_END= /DNA_ORIENTATION=